ncbi:MAG: hypothetical protein ACJAYE_001105 [Candidatus Azotimanducaceae bacterium]|jgi:hypothetical protein
MKEVELYPPIKQFFEDRGYEVQGEVKHCDLVAHREEDDQIVIVELKTSPSMGLLVQATERQTISDCVYVAIPAKKYRRSQWRGIQRVIKQLGLGLLVVTSSKLGQVVTEYFEPAPMRKIQSRKRKAVKKELAERNASYNIGGTTRTELMTAYRQNAILIACFLDMLGESSAAQMKKLGAPANTLQIVSSNHYGWFERVSRGIYQLTTVGNQAPEKYSEIWQTAKKVVIAARPKLTAKK